MKNVLLTVLILLPILSIAQNDGQMYAKYNVAMAKGNYELAEKEIQKISNIETNTFIKYLTLGHFYGQKGHLDSAKHYLENAVDHLKYQPISYADPSFTIQKDSLYTVAVDIYDIIIENDPSDVNYCNRGIFKKDIGLTQEAIVDFKIAIELDSTDYLNYYNIGLAYKAARELDSAILSYDKAIQYNPNYGSSYLNKGFVLIELESYYLAIEEFDLALTHIESQKETSFTLNNIGYCHYKLNMYEKAKYYIEESLRINPLNSYAHRNLAWVYIGTNKTADACSSIQTAIELGFVEHYGNEILEMKEANCVE